MKDVAAQLGLAPAYVEGVATFYTMYNKAPVGRHHLEVCHNIVCMVRGADDLIDQFLAGIASARIPGDVFHDEAVLDATVPNWRYQVHSATAVRAEFSKWYADPGRFDDVRRTNIPGGELVEFTLSWNEDGVEHRCHQAHVLQLQGDRVVKDTAWCGGRWPSGCSPPA